MVVYADLIFLLNGYMDFLLLWLTSGIRKQRVSIWRLILSAIIGGIYSMFHLWSAFSLAYFFPVKILVSMVMILIGFGFNHPLSYLRNLGVFYFVCFITGGAMIALHYVITGDTLVAGGIFFTQTGNGWGSPVSWFLIIVGFPLVWVYTRFSFRSLAETDSVSQFLAKVRIQLDGNIIECMGLVDTGNQLHDPITRNPVMMVELAQFESWIPPGLKQLIQNINCDKNWSVLPSRWINRIRIIPYRVVGNEARMMIAFKPDKVEILKEDKWNNIDKILIGIDAGYLSSDGTYQAIIHPSCVN